MSHYAPFRRKRLRLRRRNQPVLPDAGPLSELLVPPDVPPAPVQNEYSQPAKFKPKAPGGLKHKLAYSSLAVLAAASVVVTGLAMAPRTPPPPSGAAEAYLADRETAPEPEPEAVPAPSRLSLLETEITAALAAAAWPSPLLPGEADPELEAVFQEAAAGCTPGGTRTCSLTPGDMSRTAVVVGDASAAVWVPALRRNLEPQGWRVLSLAHLDCPLPLQAAAAAPAGDECALHAEAVAQAVAQAAPGLVVVSNTRAAGTGAQWEEGLRVLHEQWLAPAGQVIAVGAVPQAGEALVCQEAGLSPADCTVALDFEWTEAVAAEHGAAEAAAAVFLDPAAWLCASDGRCPAFAGGVPVRHDGALSPAFAVLLDPVFGEAVLTVLNG